MKIFIKNEEVLIDKSSLNIIKSRLWHISDNGYVVWRGIENGKKKTVRLHRLVIKAKDNEIVDHINRNKLDNRLCNLRICTQKENIHNSDKFDKYKLYYYSNSRKRWIIDSKRFNICMVVNDEEEAKHIVKCLKNGNKFRRNLIRRCHQQKLSYDDIDKMITEYDSNTIPKKDICKKYNISYSTLRRYKKGIIGKGYMYERRKKNEL